MNVPFLIDGLRFEKNFETDVTVQGLAALKEAGIQFPGLGPRPAPTRETAPSQGSAPA